MLAPLSVRLLLHVKSSSVLPRRSCRLVRPLAGSKYGRGAVCYQHFWNASLWSITSGLSKENSTHALNHISRLLTWIDTAGSPLQCQAIGKDQLGQGQQEGSTSTSLPAMPRPAQMMPNPARLLSKELSLEGVIGSMSMDRSLSEFLHEVTCL